MFHKHELMLHIKGRMTQNRYSEGSLNIITSTQRLKKHEAHQKTASQNRRQCTIGKQWSSGPPGYPFQEH